ncbi:hypothetical protein ASE17_08455 [Phenylobacterium sp. Root77]|jgi:hypothetical protein|uniref:DUF6491 family protein n=1 Tax=unclassified Phenylobacterium TaxID=2640670 RepID=UPI0006F567BE|nr:MULTISPECIES: DUF6491 family protein [unclassified Phenylobacterium]KQW72978.1 hypothetical protein ASC73_01025 [Phenylobacterium sp. Root1277]KQW92197.1 hypothetical protein ASC79_11735 [Phenylobacterium sp. Root1290]KRC40428.1 hypothetical protein ASE17_08455 [Phenylobacterium sp. Root77]
MLRLVLAAALTAALAAPALAQEPAKPAASSAQCFRMSQIDNHTKGDNQTLYLSVRHRDVYRLDMSGSCLAGASSNDALVMTPTAGIDLICRPLDLDLKVRTSPGMLSPCIIKDITKLTPDQIAALPPKVKP